MIVEVLVGGAVALLVSAVVLGVLLAVRTEREVVANVRKVAGYPIVGSGLTFFRNPTRFLQDCRKEYGDVFQINLFTFQMIYVFSPTTLEEFYKLRETEASFTEATRTFLGLKIPNAILNDGSMKTIFKILKKNFFHHLLSLFNTVVTNSITLLRDRIGVGSYQTNEGEGCIDDIFLHVKETVHKMGFVAWLGELSLDDRYYGDLMRCFVALDPEDGFKDGRKLMWTILTAKYFENKAFNNFVDIVQRIHQEKLAKNIVEHNILENLYEAYREDGVEAVYQNISRDIMILHLASQSNLFAAITWTFLDIVAHPDIRRHIKKQVQKEATSGDFMLDASMLDRLTILDACFNESIRLRQQSLTLRKVMKDELNISTLNVTVPKGYYLATLLSCTNRNCDFLSRADSYDPLLHYDGDHLLLDNSADRSPEPIDYTFSTFGHGIHSCPGRRFSSYAMKIFVLLYLDAFDFSIPQNQKLSVTESQFGAVGRPDRPIRLIYSERTSDA